MNKDCQIFEERASLKREEKKNFVRIKGLGIQPMFSYITVGSLSIRGERQRKPKAIMAKIKVGI